MANRYCNLVGTNKIKDEWHKINEGFDKVQQEMDEHVGSGGNAHALATSDEAGFMSSEDKDKLDNIEEGAEVNQNAFAKVNELEADNPSDELTIEGGTGITVITNPNNKKITITATGTSTPGKHGSSHTEFGSDPIPFASETEGGLMSAEDKQTLNKVGDLNDLETTEKNSLVGAVNEVKQNIDAHLADDTIHKTSDVIRSETNTQLKVEVVSSSVSETPDAGRIIFDMSQGKFFGGNGTEWV